MREWSHTASTAGFRINSPYMDSCVAISKNGLSLYFASNRHTGDAANANWDLYVSKRASVKDAWEEPVQIATLNSDAMDSCPALSPDEFRLYFSSNRFGGCG